MSDAPAVTYALTDADQLNFAWDNLLRSHAVVLVACLVLGVLFVIGGMESVVFLFVAAALQGFGVLLFAMSWFQTRSNVLAELRARPLHGTSITLAALQTGLDLRGAESVLHGWELVGAPKVTRSSIGLPVGHVTKLLIPRRAFVDREAERAFLATVKLHRSSPPVTLPEPPDDGPYTYDLSYTSTYADLLALNTWFMFRHEPPGRRRMMMFGALAVCGGLMLGAIVDVYALAPSAVMGLVALASTVRGRALLVRYRVWRLWRRGGHDEGEVRLRARPDAVAYRGRSSMKTTWINVDPIVDAPDHVFLFNGPATAWIVPKAVLGDRVQSFLEDTRRWVAEAAPHARPSAPKADVVDTSNPFQAPTGD